MAEPEIRPPKVNRLRPINIIRLQRLQWRRSLELEVLWISQLRTGLCTKLLDLLAVCLRG
jgi:hypothetical protein